MRSNDDHNPAASASAASAEDEEAEMNGSSRRSSHHTRTNGGSSNKQGGNEEGVLLIPSGGQHDDARTKKRATRTKATGDTGTGSGAALPGKRRVRRHKKEAADESSSGSQQAKFIKYAALLLLVAQMVGLVLLMRYSRTVPRGDDEPLYLASTAVFVMEVMKLVICLAVVAQQTGITHFFQEIHHHTVGSPLEILKLCVPSLLYTVQNNLLYLALTNLDAATYQVCYQLKILTTALFSAILLQRKFSPTKWAALVLLTLGVAIVQISGSGDQHSSTHGDTHETEEHRAEAEAAALAHSNRIVGLLAVVCAACTSGFSGVYFGKLYVCTVLDCRFVWLFPIAHSTHAHHNFLPSLRDAGREQKRSSKAVGPRSGFVTCKWDSPPSSLPTLPFTSKTRRRCRNRDSWVATRGSCGRWSPYRPSADSLWRPW